MWSSVKRVLKSVTMALVAGSGGAEAQSPAYPDHWESYLGERAGHPALILYNAGIEEVLGSLPEQTVLTVAIPLKLTPVDGLPSPEEGPVLFQLDDAFGPIISDFAAHDLGRVSSQGQRRVYVLAGENAQALGNALLGAAASLGYTVVVTTDTGGVKQLFSDVLSPTEDERRLIGDQSVLRQLAENGDIAAQVRPVDHWARFPSRETADEFAAWLGQNGFSNVAVEEMANQDWPFIVKSSHTGTMLPEDILKRTLQQHQAARTFGGTYDGWETAVMR